MTKDGSQVGTMKATKQAPNIPWSKPDSGKTGLDLKITVVLACGEKCVSREPAQIKKKKKKVNR